MNDIYIIYCVFMYLVTFGMVFAGVKNGDHQDRVILTGMIINFIFAPIITPFVFGLALYDTLD